MGIQRLDHVNVRTAQLDVMIRWYDDVLGIKTGHRADFPFPGAWIYAGETAAVHLIEVAGDAGAGSEAKLKLEHFAFSATDLTGFLAHLDARGERYERSELPSEGLTQINVWDPDGNHIHVDFKSNETS